MTRPATTGTTLGPMADAGPLLPFHFESDVELNGPADAVFSHLDDHIRLSAHMTKPSWIMAGSRMAIELDASEGRAVGAIIRLRGRVLGIPVSVEEVITERTPPLRKVWGTTGRPQLVVIGSYRMGYEITPKAHFSRLRVFIDYALPDGSISYWLGRLFGSFMPAGAPSAWSMMRQRISKTEGEYLAIHAVATMSWTCFALDSRFETPTLAREHFSIAGIAAYVHG